MKKTIIMCITLVFLATMVFAGTISGPTQPEDAPNQKIITISCTASGTTFADTEIDDGELKDLEGYWLSHVFVTPGTTGPTDDCDLTIKMGGVDILGGNGTDIVDNAISGYCTPYGSSGDAQFPVLLGKTLIVGISGNSVDSAVTTITLVFDR